MDMINTWASKSSKSTCTNCSIMLLVMHKACLIGCGNTAGYSLSSSKSVLAEQEVKQASDMAAEPGMK